MTRIRKIGLFVVLPLFCLAALLHIYLPAEADKGWLLYAARKFLAGGQLSTDIIEINPPLIVWFYALPVWISLHVPWIRDFEALGCIGLLFCVLSVAVCARLIRRHPGFEGNRQRQMEFAVLLALIFIYYNTQPYFFDREHIFLVLTFPYVLRFMPSLAEKKFPLPLRITVGVLGAFGFCIKPHTIIVFLAIQLFTALHARTIRALFTLENLIILLAGAVYLCLIWHFTPDYYLDIVPMAFATYSEYGNQGGGYVYLPSALISLGVVFADFRMWYVTPYRRDVYYFLWLCVALCFYALANNGWGYTYNPLLCMVLMVTGWMLWEYYWLKAQHDQRGLSTRSFLFGVRGCFLVLVVNAAWMVVYMALVTTGMGTLRSTCGSNPECWNKLPYTAYMHEHDIHTFGTIAYDFSDWVFVQHMTGAAWVTRFNHLWMMPKIMVAGKQFVLDHFWVVEYVARGLAQDLTQRKPEVMFIDSSPGFHGRVRHDDMLEMLERVPEFREAMRHYHYETTLGNCPQDNHAFPSLCEFDVYRYTP